MGADPMTRRTPLQRFARALRRIAMSTVTRNAERPVLMAVAKAAERAARWRHNASRT